jgi:hypothetical protein
MRAEGWATENALRVAMNTLLAGTVKKVPVTGPLLTAFSSISQATYDILAEKTRHPAPARRGFPNGDLVGRFLSEPNRRVRNGDLKGAPAASSLQSTSEDTLGGATVRGAGAGGANRATSS